MFFVTRVSIDLKLHKTRVYTLVLIVVIWFMFSKLTVSTSVVVGNANCNFDINAIYKYLELGDYVIKLKCNNKEKTKDHEIVCKTFYNQISISLKDKTNIKLFNNGKFQVSGIKNIKEAEDKTNVIFDMIKKIEGRIKINPLLYNGLYIHTNKILKKYKNTTEDLYICSNLIKNEKIIIDGNICEKFDLIDDVYVEKRHTDKKKKIYNIFCEEIGYIEYVMIRKNKNLCVKNCIYNRDEDNQNEFIITNKYKNILGKLILCINGEVISQILPETVDMVYFACSEKPEITKIETVNKNSNMKILLDRGSFVNRENICEFLSSNDINFTYDPCTYPGIKISMDDVKITIFRTGSILFSSKKEVIDAYDFVAKIFEDNPSFIKIKSIEKEKEKEKDISIWDL